MRATGFFKFWLPVILWMLLIFGASTNLGAPQNTSRIIGPFLRWLNPDVSQETVEFIQFCIRKSCHALEYAILCLLLWRARRNTASVERGFVADQPQRVENTAAARGRHGRAPQGWSWRDARFAILVSVLYAATDEFHQSFVITRQGSNWDVLIDTCGAVAGILALWQIGRWLKRW